MTDPKPDLDALEAAFRHIERRIVTDNVRASDLKRAMESWSWLLARARAADAMEAVARYADNVAEYATFHEKHPNANSIELWGAAMGRASQVAAERDALRAENAEMRAVLEAVVECAEECHHDHHGLCQAHSLRSRDGEPECEIALARAALAAGEGRGDAT